MPVLVHRDFAGAWTEGLAVIGRRELLVEVDHPSLVDAAAEFLRSTATALELERYLALPNGHAFRTGRGVELSIVWDPEIAALVR